MSSKKIGGSQKILVQRFIGNTSQKKPDVVVREEPLELRMAGQTLTTTMRTPGHDFELALGWALSEGTIAAMGDVQKVSYCVSSKLEQRFNVVNIKLRAGVNPKLSPRHSLSSSACGVCGKSSLQELEVRCAGLPSGLVVLPEVLYQMPDGLRQAQRVFDSTGGIHAAGLFSSSGKLLVLREDVGRHNAVDKVVGWALMNGVQLENTVLLVSGRGGFEIAQKAVTAGIVVLACVSAPSDLAVAVAKRFGLTLIGFLRGETMNVYAGFERITASSPNPRPLANSAPPPSPQVP
jgi:FdhD protein